LTRPEVYQIARVEPKAGVEWKRIEFPVPMVKEYPADKVAISIMFGGQKQEVEIADLALVAMDDSYAQALQASRPKINGVPAADAGQSWKMIWNDEFDGTSLDASKWVIGEGKRHDAMRSPKAVKLDGEGHLVMGIFREGDTVYNSWVDTGDKFVHAYGFYTARMKMHASTGHWNAFWLQTTSTGDVDGSGRDGTEIDIMEKPWIGPEVNHALHWDGYGADHKSAGLRSINPGVMEGWHTFSLLWTPDIYVFYVDDYEVYRTNAGGVCQVPAQIRLTDEAEAKDNSWAGNVKNAKLPDAWMVDYVRVYDLFDASGKPVFPVRTAPKSPVAAAAMPSDGNLIRNGGFESAGVWSLNNWAKNDVLLETDTANPHSGAAAQKITVRAIKTSPVTEFVQEVPIKPGQKASLSFWVRGNVPTLKAELRQMMPPFASLFSLPATPSDEWKEYTASISVAENAGAARITFRIEGVGTLWLDDVRMAAE
ncbi:MAG: family 16 glycosylhydrolase, partial [Spirochaetota bacterium]